MCHAHVSLTRGFEKKNGKKGTFDSRCYFGWTFVQFQDSTCGMVIFVGLRLCAPLAPKSATTKHSWHVPQVTLFLLQNEYLQRKWSMRRQQDKELQHKNTLCIYIYHIYVYIYISITYIYISMYCTCSEDV